MFGSSYKSLLLIGKKENLEIVKWLREMLSERFVEISNEKWKEYKKTEEYLLHPTISKDRFQRGFLMGCVAGIDEFVANKYSKVKYTKNRVVAGNSFSSQYGI